MFRAIAVVLALTAMLAVSAVAVSPQHAHLKPQNDHCDICCTAHMAGQQAVVLHVVLAPNQLNFIPPPEFSPRTESRDLLAFLTRGPPSSTVL